MSEPAVKQDKHTHWLVQWFDIIFIMALCFVTLLAMMLIHGKVLVGNGESSGLDYSVGFISCASVIILFIAYMGYMLVHSERELKEMVNHVYGERQAEESASIAAAQDASAEEGA